MQFPCKTRSRVLNVTSSVTARTIGVCVRELLSFNIARMFGGSLPKDRASLIAREPLQMAPREIVLTFPGPHRIRKAATG
jgi:hypothetical protein